MVPSEVSVVASDFPMLKKLSEAKNMLSGQYSGALVQRFFYRHWNFQSLTEISFMVLRILIITLNSELRFSMILYSVESLWNSLQKYPGVHLIRSCFEHPKIRLPSEGPVLGHRNFRCLTEISFLHVLIITFCSKLQFWWSWTLWKAYKILYKNIQKSISLDQVLGTDLMHQFNRCYYLMWNSTNSSFLWVLSLIFVLLGLCIHS